MKTTNVPLLRDPRALRQGSPKKRSAPWRREIFIEVFFLFFGLCLVGRLIHIQVLQAGKYQNLANVQHHAVIPIAAQRGIIYDRNYNLLALNEACMSVGVDLRQIKNRRAVAEKLARILGEPSSALLERMRSELPFVWVKRRVDPELAQKIQALGLPGIRIEKDVRRRYPHKEIAAHVLGYTDVDNHGIAGIELGYDSLLVGKDGRRVLQKDAIGNRLPELGAPDVPAVNGRNLVLTIDYKLQAIAAQELRHALDRFNAAHGTVIVTNPITGEILAMVCEPGFDPNQPGAYSAATRRNRAVTDLFEPGSTFKLTTFTAILQEGLMQTGDVIFCENGAYKFAGETVTDHGEKYGNLTVSEVLANSSNIGTVKLAKILGGKKFYQYARDYGFGMPTNLGGHGEAVGVLKPPANWSGYTLAAMAMGYEVSATALQIAMAYGAIANGGLLLEPKIVAALGERPGEEVRFDAPKVVRRLMSKKVADTMATLLEGAVQRGTGKQAAIAGVRIAGKTGTARKTLQNAKGYSRSDYIASFVGFFPVEKPRYLSFVMLENPRATYWGGTVAAPTFKVIAERILASQTGVRQTTSLEDSSAEFTSREIIMDTRNITLPDLTNRQRNVAETMLKSLGLEPVWDGAGEFIVNQMPPPGSLVFPESKVTLELFEIERPRLGRRMPSLIGLSARQALQQLALTGIDAHIVGSGKVVQQYPPPGTPISSGLRCEIRCQSNMAVMVQ